jgi:DNA invertase Pin-like site-specific DNA recombinase
VQHIAIYSRVSSKGQDFASQEADLKKWADAQKEPVKWYRDKFTGTTMDRPAFNRLEKEIAAGEVSTLVVWRLDRLGRTAKGLILLIDDLSQRKINFVSLRDGFDLSTPTGRLMFNIVASIASYETEVRSERQVAGIKAAQEKGVKFGRPRGSKKSRIPDDKRRAVMEHKSAGWKVAHIARAVGLTRKTVYSVINGQSENPACD